MDEVSWMTRLWLDDRVMVEGHGCGWMTVVEARGLRLGG